MDGGAAPWDRPPGVVPGGGGAMEELKPFAIGRLPAIRFGAGVFRELPERIERRARRVLPVVGGRSFVESAAGAWFFETLGERVEMAEPVRVAEEPSPEEVDAAVAAHRDFEPELVVAIGGGSVLDAGKAIAAMLTEEGSVMEVLEGVGKREPMGTTRPLFAVPTTAGTGSEATKNAVLSRVGRDGFKKSLRHDAFVPELALLDPELTVGLPRELTVACGMDALSQLMESYLSTGANPITDALALDGMARFAAGFPRVLKDGADVAARGQVMYAALMSGITLAHAGLAAIHALAGYIGGRWRMPHGAVCGTLLGEAMAVSIRRMRAEPEGYRVPLEKLARVGRLLAAAPRMPDGEAVEAVPNFLREWTQRLELPRLSDHGIARDDLAGIARGSGLKSHPCPLSEGELMEVLAARW
ncbi:MAG: iron-containing alcohol dehydrogenase [Puniceicoccaceae bacterium]|nr:MAG: iron-containing alcohol dehydrogenase [Puniceicoccaceae bacterium]